VSSCCPPSNQGGCESNANGGSQGNIFKGGGGRCVKRAWAHINVVEAVFVHAVTPGMIWQWQPRFTIKEIKPRAFVIDVNSMRDQSPCVCVGLNSTM
jgi:hypothetical protein